MSCNTVLHLDMENYLQEEARAVDALKLGRGSKAQQLSLVKERNAAA